MGTVPVPYTWTAGDDATSARMQSLTDGGLYSLGSATSGGSKRPLCKMRQTAAQSIANTLTAAAITWDTEDVDYDNGHSTSTNTSRYTAQTAGWYELTATVGRAVTAGGAGVIEAYFLVNGTGNAFGDCLENGSTTVTVSFAMAGLIYLNVGDYVEVYIAQNGSAAANVACRNGNPSFQVKWVSN